MAGLHRFIDCPNSDCGIPVDPVELSCPKCDAPLREAFRQQYYEIDVAHAGQTREIARHEIEEGLNTALLYGFKGLKVIHGYGGAHRSRGIIAREAKYTLQVIARRKGYGLRRDAENPGAHLIDF